MTTETRRWTAIPCTCGGTGCTSYRVDGLYHADGTMDKDDALLIAQAPALLAAAEDLVGVGAQHEHTCDIAEHDEDGPCIFCALRAAIEEATS